MLAVLDGLSPFESTPRNHTKQDPSYFFERMTLEMHSIILS